MRTLLAALTTLALSTGCLAMAAGYGIAKATEGDEVYVCEDVPTATSKTELADMMEDTDYNHPDRSGERVEIKEKGRIEVSDAERNIVFVESQDFEDRRYWVPFSAVCRSG